MNKLQLATVLTSLTLAGAAVAQQAVSPPAPDGTLAREAPAAEPGATSGTAAAKIVGRPVVSTKDAPLGKVAEVVFDSKGQPAYVVIAAGGKSAALPYATANAMTNGDKIVIDQARLLGAPTLKANEWRDQSSDEWKNDATRYWDQGA
ncbi:MAG TPA: PRC-barrel domain-containing protein [Lysobacter sp.]|jgi:hypothetical protein|nr:PRC-barrel domain-containing protein [Lysobacter sp.]